MAESQRFRDIAAALDTGGYHTRWRGSWHAATMRAVWERRHRYRALFPDLPLLLAA